MTDTPEKPLAASPVAGTDAASLDATLSAATAPADPLTPPERSLWTSISNPFALGFALTLGALVAILLGLAFSNLSTVLIYIAFALFAALGLEPAVRWLTKHKVKRAWGIVIVYTAFALALVAVLWLIIPTVVRQIAQFISDVPKIVDDFQSTDFYAWLQSSFGDQVGGIISEVEKFLVNPANIATIGGGVLQVGVSIATTISGIIIIIVLSLYFLASLDGMKHSLTRFAPARNRPKVASLTDEIADSIGSYLGGMVILAFCNSVLSFLLYFFLGLPFPALMAVIAFCITLIPLVGTVLFWLIASTLALFSSPVSALVFAIIYLIYMQIEAYVLTPRVMSKAVSVPGALVVIGALVGGTLLGLLGALIAIPVTASILLIIKQIVIPKQDAKV